MKRQHCSMRHTGWLPRKEIGWGLPQFHSSLAAVRTALKRSTMPVRGSPRPWLDFGASPRRAGPLGRSASLLHSIAGWRSTRAAIQRSSIERCCAEALGVFQTTGHLPGIIRALHGLAYTAYKQRDFAKSLATTHELLALAWQSRRVVYDYLDDIADIAGRLENPSSRPDLWRRQCRQSAARQRAAARLPGRIRSGPLNSASYSVAPSDLNQRGSRAEHGPSNRRYLKHWNLLQRDTDRQPSRSLAGNRTYCRSSLKV